MLPEPLHPMMVHLPLGLASLMPFLAAAVLVAAWRGWLPDRAWWGIVALQAVLAGGTFVAVRTGEQEEDRVEKVAPRAAVHRHEEAGEGLRNAVTATFVVALGAALVRRPPLRRLVAALALAGMATGLVFAWRAGKAGGELVYRHGAASAYGTPGDAAAPGPADD